MLALLIGICGDAFLSALMESVVPFSLLPLIALLLAASQLYQHYRHEPMVGNTQLHPALLLYRRVRQPPPWSRCSTPSLAATSPHRAMLLLLAALSIKLNQPRKRNQE